MVMFYKSVLSFRWNHSCGSRSCCCCSRGSCWATIIVGARTAVGTIWHTRTIKFFISIWFYCLIFTIFIQRKTFAHFITQSFSIDSNAYFNIVLILRLNSGSLERKSSVMSANDTKTIRGSIYWHVSQYDEASGHGQPS